MKVKVAVFWFRRDLRLNDNAGLYFALRSGLPVIPLFIYDKNILDKLANKSDQRLLFIHDQLSLMQMELRKINSGLLTIYDEPLQAWKKIIRDYKVAEVFSNEDYEPYARQRDSTIAGFLVQNNIPFRLFKDQVIFNPVEVLKDNGSPYTIYTPYKNKWRAGFNATLTEPFPSVQHHVNFYKWNPEAFLSPEHMGFVSTKVNVPPGYTDGKVIENYASCRDFPAINGTSRLSVHLRFGTVSIRALVKKAMPVSETWINELIWREFYMMILYHFPYAGESAFKPNYNRIKWRNNEQEFKSWCSGQTGYPIVDAGMRELNTTGFMHNRVRMITAGFLTKHLLIDWRWGEAYFAEKLLDFDMAANNGGWQWAAGTGCDAAPYFRIFNPYEQTKKFDPQCIYIRKWVPEFEELSYPGQIVDHKYARERCLAVYKASLAERV